MMGKKLMFIAMGIAMLLLVGGMAYYLVYSFHRLSFIQKIAENRGLLSWGAALLLTALVLLPFYLWKTMNGFTAAFYLMIFLAAGALTSFILKKAGAAEISVDARMIAALLLTALVLFFGYVSDHRVVRTEYTVSTEKNIDGNYRIVFFSDAHMGTTFHADKWADYVERINEEDADVILIIGDLLDDSSSLQDLIGSCEAFRNLKAKDGVYFVYGNHDRGYRNSRAYTEEQLIFYLTENGVQILQDETVQLSNGLILTGREDKSWGVRKPMEELKAGVRDGSYWIVADHQPNDYAAETEAGADLVLSGHTHGGQLVPFDFFVRLFNDQTYGIKERRNTSFIVSSGISNWAMDFKTGTVSEYVVVNLEKK